MKNNFFKKLFSNLKDEYYSVVLTLLFIISMSMNWYYIYNDIQVTKIKSEIVTLSAERATTPSLAKDALLTDSINNKMKELLYY